MKELNADHIDFVDYIPVAEPGIPRANSSLTLRIHQRAISKDTKSVGRRIRDVFDELEAMLDIHSLKLVGMIPKPASQIGITIVASSPLVTDAHVFESVAKHIEETIITRFHYENNADLRVASCPTPVPKARLLRFSMHISSQRSDLVSSHLFFYLSFTSAPISCKFSVFTPFLLPDPRVAYLIG